MNDTKPDPAKSPTEVAAEFLRKQPDLATRCPQSPNGVHVFRNSQCYYCQLNKPR